MRTNVWMFFLLLLVCGCADEREQWLQRAEACMEDDPACAYQCLQQIDSTGGLTDAARAKYALLQVQAMHKCRMPLADDSLINTAVAYYQRVGNRHRLAKSLLYKGLVHKECGEVEQAVEAFAASELSFKGVEDDQYKALLFDHYGMLLAKQTMYEEALHYFKLTKEHELRGDSVHYVVSTYRRMAMMYDVLGYRDSARVCYAEGLSFATDKGVQSRNYHLLLQNYASFLTEEGSYPEAERLLLQCADRLADSAYIYTLYSSLATLYYEKGEYESALEYAERVVESGDSLTACSGYLRLYMIYRDMGDMETAVRYHDLYRAYENDMAARKRTAKVAALPHKVENRLLKEENRVWQLRQWVWMLLAVAVLLGAWVLLRILRNRHRKEQQASITQLKDMERTLADTELQLGETATNLGGLKGVVTNQTNALNHLREEQRRVKEEHKQEIKRLRDSIKALESDIRALKEEDHALKKTESEQRQNQKMLQRELKSYTDQLDSVLHQREIDRRLNYFVLAGHDTTAVAMLMQLRYGKENARVAVRTSEYLPLLKTLLKLENPEMNVRLETCGLEWNKLTICYLLALGIDDVEMMARAACLAPNTVKAYLKECKKVVDEG